MERPVVEVRLELRQRGDDLVVAEQEAHSPARHREGLRERVELDGDVLRTRDLQDRRRLIAVEPEIRVREVVHDDHLACARECDELLHEGEIDTCRRRVVRKRRDDDAWARPRLFVRGAHVVEEVLAGAHADVVHAGAGEDRAPDVNRVRRARNQRGVARTEQRQHQMREALLGTDRRAHFGFEVERDTERALVEVGDGETQLRNTAARRVPVIARVADCFDQLVDGELGWRRVGVAEREVDDVFAGPPELHLQRVDLRECIGRKRVNAAEVHGDPG